MLPIIAPEMRHLYPTPCYFAVSESHGLVQKMCSFSRPKISNFFSVWIFLFLFIWLWIDLATQRKVAPVLFNWIYECCRNFPRMYTSLLNLSTNPSRKLLKCSSGTVLWPSPVTSWELVNPNSLRQACFTTTLIGCYFSYYSQNPMCIFYWNIFFFSF